MFGLGIGPPRLTFWQALEAIKLRGAPEQRHSRSFAERGWSQRHLDHQEYRNRFTTVGVSLARWSQ